MKNPVWILALSLASPGAAADGRPTRVDLVDKGKCGPEYRLYQRWAGTPMPGGGTGHASAGLVLRSIRGERVLPLKPLAQDPAIQGSYPGRHAEGLLVAEDKAEKRLIAILPIDGLVGGKDYAFYYFFDFPGNPGWDSKGICSNLKLDQ
jgi:hypothetical protein